MIVLEILGAVVIIIIGVIIVSQVIVPAAFGRLLFPFFRKTSELDHQLIELDQLKSDLEKAEQVRQAADEIARVSQPNQPKE